MTRLGKVLCRQRCDDHQTTHGYRMGTKGFYVADPDGYIIGFSGSPATD